MYIVYQIELHTGRVHDFFGPFHSAADAGDFILKEQRDPFNFFGKIQINDFIIALLTKPD